MVELSQASATSHRFAFGGVAFELELGHGVNFQPSSDFTRHVANGIGTGLPFVAKVQCAVSLDSGLPRDAIAGISISQEGSTTYVACDELRAAIRRESELSFRAKVRISGAALAADALMLGLSAALLQSQGGLHMHASALELDGRAVLVIGPSGAGKSTALELTLGASVLAFDRVALARSLQGEWSAWSLPGGEPVPVRWSDSRTLPVAAILRVRQGAGRPQLRVIRGAERLFALRESVDVSDLSVAAEDARMNAVERVSAQLLVGEIETVLATPHTALLREFLARYSHTLHPMREGEDRCLSLA